MHSRALIPVMTTFLEGFLDLGDGRNEAEHFATYGLKETAKDITSGFGYAITTGLKRGLPKAIETAASTGWIDVDDWGYGEWSAEGGEYTGEFDRPAAISARLKMTLPMKFILEHVRSDVSAQDSDLRYDIKEYGAVQMDDALSLHYRVVEAFVASRLNLLLEGKIEQLLDEKIEAVYDENVDRVPEDAELSHQSIGSPAEIKDLDVEFSRQGLEITVDLIASEDFKGRHRSASSDRSALIRLASRMPKGDKTRRAILSGLRISTRS